MPDRAPASPTSGFTSIRPCLWFKTEAEEAARFYCSIFPDSRVETVQRAPADSPGGKQGDVLTVDFTLMGRAFNALNGGVDFPFTEAVSMQVPCQDQSEVERYASALSAEPDAEHIGWIKDRYGLSWQIIPVRLLELLSDPDPARAERVMKAMLGMKRLDVAALERAARG